MMLSVGSTTVAYLSENRCKRWLEVFPSALLQTGFEPLTQKMNQFVCPWVHRLNLQLIFSCAWSDLRGIELPPHMIGHRLEAS